MTQDINPITGTPVLSVGTEVWLVTTDYVAVKCKIDEIEDWRVIGKHPAGAVYYYVDEPTGNAIGEGDEFYLTRVEAVEVLTSMFEDLVDDNPGSPSIASSKIDKTLEDWRRRSVEWIIKTHGETGKDEEYGKPPFLYPARERGEEWFNLRDLGYT